MWNLRSTAHHVVPAFICLISLLLAVGAHAQTATTDASDTKRVQVLQVQEASATNESSVKKSKSAAIPAKKKVVQRKTISQTKAAANEGVNAAGAKLPNPNTPVLSTMAVIVPATPAPNDILTHSAEQNWNTYRRRSRGCSRLWRGQQRRSFRCKLRGNQGRPIGK